MCSKGVLGSLPVTTTQRARTLGVGKTNYSAC